MQEELGSGVIETNFFKKGKGERKEELALVIIAGDCPNTYC